MLAEQNGDRATDYYVVHRLDKAASGLLVLARDRQTAGELSRQLTENRLRKTYLCVVPGVPAPVSGEMQDLLYQDKMKKKMFPVKRKRAGVKEASLTYRVLETQAPLTLVEVELQTGRFHQIRCQFAARKLPLVGDGKYGSRVWSPHLALFCRQLSFYDAKEKKECSFTAAPPAEFPWTAFSCASDEVK